MMSDKNAIVTNNNIESNQGVFNKISNFSISANTLEMMIISNQLNFLSDNLCLWLFDEYTTHSQYDKAMLILEYRIDIMNISSFSFSVDRVIKSNNEYFMNFLRTQIQNNLITINFPLKDELLRLLTNRCQLLRIY